MKSCQKREQDKSGRHFDGTTHYPEKWDTHVSVLF